MSQSLSKILVHLIFSTKHREPLITPDIRPRLHGYIVGILDNLQSPSLQTGGVADHVHVLFALSRTISPAEVVEQVKKSSSKWMKADGGVPAFSWQAGYGAFSVSESNGDAVIQYIRNQDEHHRKVTFQDEFRKFLESSSQGVALGYRVGAPLARNTDLAKMRLASSRVSLEPMSYQRPGTVQV